MEKWTNWFLVEPKEKLSLAVSKMKRLFAPRCQKGNKEKNVTRKGSRRAVIDGFQIEEANQRVILPQTFQSSTFY